MPTRNVSVGTVLVLLAFSVCASADPVTVTSGAVNLSGFGRGQFNSITLSLNTDDGLFVTGIQGDGVFERFLPPCTFVPCAAGATTSATQQFSFVNALGSTTIGSAPPANTLTSGFFSFDAGLVTIPESTAATLLLGSPFTFSGTLDIDALDPSRHPLTSLTLTGSGTATARLERIGDAFAVRGITYDFASAGASPTPEPASLLLLGSGAVMLFRRAAHRR